MAAYNEQLCNEKHKVLNDVLQEHHLRLNDQESRISEMEKNSVKMDEVIRQNIEKTNDVIESNKELNQTMVNAIDKLAESVTETKVRQQEFYVDSLNARKDLSDKILENQYKPSSDNWKLLMGAVITGIIGLVFYLIQSGMAK